MPYQPPARNFDRVQHAHVRKDVDPLWAAEDDELSAAYYDHWKQGDYTVTYRGYAPAAGSSREQAKALFDRLSNHLWQRRMLAFEAKNAGLPSREQIPRDEWDYTISTDSGSKRLTEHARDVVARDQNDGIDAPLRERS